LTIAIIVFSIIVLLPRSLILAIITSGVFVTFIGIGILLLESTKFKLTLYSDRLVITRFRERLSIDLSNIKEIIFRPVRYRFIRIPQIAQPGIRITATVWSLDIVCRGDKVISNIILLEEDKEKLYSALKKVVTLRNYDIIIKLGF